MKKNRKRIDHDDQENAQSNEELRQCRYLLGAHIPALGPHKQMAT